MHSGWFDRKTRGVRDLSCGYARVLLELEIQRTDCSGCGQLKRKRLESVGQLWGYEREGGAPERRSPVEWLEWLLLMELDDCYLQSRTSGLGRLATVDDRAEFGEAQPCYSTDQSARRNAKREVVMPSTYAVECGSRPLRSVSVRQPIDPIGPG